MEFIDIQRMLVRAVLKLPIVTSFDGRTSLLHGLPVSVPLQRSESSAQLDLNNIVNGLSRMGRLTNDGGARPLIVVVDNALSYVPDGSAVGEELQDVKALLEAHYGGDWQIQTEEPISAATLEALVFGPQRDTRVNFAFVQKAYTVARSIARLTIPRVFNGEPDGRVSYGTAWIIAPGVLITNHHVIDARDPRPLPFGEASASQRDFEAQALGVTADFDYFSEDGAARVQRRASRLLAYSRELDYAILEIDGADAIADRESIRLESELAMTRGARINIAQHPNGGPLRFAIRNNFFVRPDGDSPFVLYQSDTEPGASGSPVCNDDWRVVALHHGAQEVPPESVPQEVMDGAPTKVTVLNRAVRIREVLNDLHPGLKERILSAHGDG